MIKNIEINKLVPHPQNPRKELGDLKELSESIKKNGVFQNLTVVPDSDGTYTIIIGHRRHAAAKEAGLKELPCAVVDMTEKEQLATMLLENMQREDLSVLEQAEGFQLMIDLGESIKTISEQTGFSQSTVRHRLKINELDSKKLRKANEKADAPINIKDYILLEKIKDIDTRNKMLNYLGSADFAFKVNKEIAAEKDKALKEKFKSLFASLNYIDITNENCRWNKYQSLRSFVCNETNLKDYVRPSEANDVEQLYYAIDYGWVYIYKEKDKSKQKADEAKRDKEEAKRKEKIAKITAVAERVKEDIYRFVDSYKSNNAFTNDIVKLFLFLTIREPHIEIDIDGIIDNPSEIYEESELKDIKTSKSADEVLLRIIINTYMSFEPFTGYYGDFVDGYKEKNQSILTSLIRIGYKSSTEVVAFFDGTHEVYK